jgi:hypothetical protein
VLPTHTSEVAGAGVLVGLGAGVAVADAGVRVAVGAAGVAVGAAGVIVTDTGTVVLIGSTTSAGLGSVDSACTVADGRMSGVALGANTGSAVVIGC